LLQSLVLAIGFGVVTASVLAIAALGVTLQFGVTNYVNFAYGAYMALAGYVAWQLNHEWGLNIWLAVAITAVFMAVFAVAANRFLLQPFNRRNPPRVYMLILTLGLWLIVLSGILVVWGPDVHSYSVSHQSPLHLGPWLFTPVQLAVVALAVVIMLAVHLLLTRTKLGKAMRAMSDDAALARVSGIDADRMVTITWLLVGFLVGLAGCVLALNISSFEPAFGDDFLFIVFSAVILGGIGQPYGTMLGALIIGIVTEVAAVFITSSYKSDVAFALLIVMLLIRPQGLIPARGRQ
jgi:branched-subunit amino acid ABC-type transport system permease component